MYPNGAVELCHVFDHCPPAVNAYEQMEFGRYFAAFVQGNNKQRYFIEVELKDDWFFEFRQVTMEDLHWMQSRTFNWNCETH